MAAGAETGAMEGSVECSADMEREAGQLSAPRPCGMVNPAPAPAPAPAPVPACSHQQISFWSQRAAISSQLRTQHAAISNQPIRLALSPLRPVSWESRHNSDRVSVSHGPTPAHRRSGTLHDRQSRDGLHHIRS
jgi:hypothetical protein